MVWRRDEDVEMDDDLHVVRTIEVPGPSPAKPGRYADRELNLSGDNTDQSVRHLSVNLTQPSIIKVGV